MVTSGTMRISRVIITGSGTHFGPEIAFEALVQANIKSRKLE